MSKDPSFATKLDITQPIHLTDEMLHDAGLTDNEIKLLRSLPPTQISSLVPYVVAMGGKARARMAAEALDLRAEINTEGQRRCIYVAKSGTRCGDYGTKNLPVCKKHNGIVTMMGNFFRSQKLRDIYNAFNESPEKLKCDNELALMRTMLASLISKLDGDSINLELIGAVTAMSEKITGVVDRMSKLEQITPEQLNILMAKMVEVASKYVPVDKLNDFAKEVEAIELHGAKTVMPKSISFSPGDDVEMPDGTVRTVEGIVMKRALVDTAQRMGVTPDTE